MKKVFYACALMAALVACARMNPEEPMEEVLPANSKVLTIKAQKTDSDTKTSYAGDKTFSWNVGDQISVICNNGVTNMWVTFTATTAAASSAFQSGIVDENVVIGALDGTKVALYPASDSHVYNGSASGEISFHIPAVRDFRSGHSESAIPMFAWGTAENTYAFSNLTGAAKFTFTGVPCSTVKMVYTVPGVKLNGTYSLLHDGINKANSSNVHWEAGDAASASEKTVTYYGDVVGGIGGTVSFYLPYAEGTVSGPSTLQLIDAATDMVLYNNTTVGNINITKNRIAVLPDLSLSFKSAYDINWSEVPQGTSSGNGYYALNRLKATADATYIYLYIEAAPGWMYKEHDYDHCFHFYKEDASGVGQYWRDSEYDPIKNSEIDAAHAKWAVKDGLIAFVADGTDVYSSNLLMHPTTWYYEIRMKRSVDTAFANSGTVKIGVTLDDAYKQGDETGHSNWEEPCGVVPTFDEDDMYELTLP